MQPRSEEDGITWTVGMIEENVKLTSLARENSDAKKHGPIPPFFVGFMVLVG